LKSRSTLTFAAGVLSLFTLAGCSTRLANLPLAPVTGNTGSAASQDVALYFGDQPHPVMRSEMADVESNARIMRQPLDDAVPVCNQALGLALDKLRSEARRRGANAVVNISTSFHRRQDGRKNTSPDTYMCGMSRNAVALRVQGRAVVLREQ
jgi:uncharacterized protein YbjQ (UPF0145 family)